MCALKYNENSMKSTALFMFGVQGQTLSTEEIAYLQHPLCAGVILFTRNFSDKAQVRELIQSIRQHAGDTLIAVDHEGGRVQRFREGFTRIPAMAKLGELYLKAPKEALKMSEQTAIVLAYELAELDIDFSFAPVLDIQNPISTIIGDRGFSSDTEALCQLTKAFYKGLRRVGFCGVGKHFPGHGNIEADSHLTLPEDHRSLETIRQQDLIPFAALIEAGIEAIMPAHILYTECDGLPAGFSTFWLQHILREKLQFEGCIISDDLDMAGAAAFGDINARIALAKTHCDLILLCNDPEHIKVAFAETAVDACAKRQKRLKRLKKSRGSIREGDYLTALAALMEWQGVG